METEEKRPEDVFASEPQWNPRRHKPNFQAVLAEVKATKLSEDLQLAFDRLVDAMEEWFRQGVEFITYEENLSVAALFIPRDCAKDPIVPERAEKALLDINRQAGLAVLIERNIAGPDWLPFLMWRPGEPTDPPRLWRPYGRWDFPPVAPALLNETEDIGPRRRAEVCAANCLHGALEGWRWFIVRQEHSEGRNYPLSDRELDEDRALKAIGAKPEDRLTHYAYQEDFKDTEIGHALGLTAKAVKNRRQRLEERLKKVLKQGAETHPI